MLALVEDKKEEEEVVVDLGLSSDDVPPPQPVPAPRKCKTTVPQKVEKKSRDLLAPLQAFANGLQQMGMKLGKSRETIALTNL